MKTSTIKSITIVLASMALTLGLIVSSCKKPEKGETGPKGETGASGVQGQAGPQAKTFNFSLTFNAGDTFKSYSGITGYTADDVVLTFIKYETLAGEGYWTQIPYLIGNAVNFVPEFGEQSGLLFITKIEIFRCNLNK
jgi:hypothetical protein